MSETMAAFLVLTGLWMVGLTNLRTKLVVYGVQTLALDAAAVSIGWQHGELALIVVGLVSALLKGLAVPTYLLHLTRHIGCRRDEGLFIAPPLLLLLTVGVLSALLLLRPMHDALRVADLPALALLLIGMILMISRRMAVSQIIGFLVLENGIFYYTIAQPRSMPLLVELGVLLELLAVAMLAGLLAFRINDRFEHIDVTALDSLRD
ncbi:MAG: hypothetical protein HZB16_17570 [Armatimonadetes bacterium]|nr:hypothetical protein [Armatimonadota bacterium]